MYPELNEENVRGRSVGCESKKWGATDRVSAPDVPKIGSRALIYLAHEFLLRPRL